jgi:hypothetical protein
VDDGGVGGVWSWYSHFLETQLSGRLESREAVARERTEPSYKEDEAEEEDSLQ